MFTIHDILIEYNLSYNMLCELLENIGELTGEDITGIICALDNIHDGEEE